MSESSAEGDSRKHAAATELEEPVKPDAHYMVKKFNYKQDIRSKQHEIFNRIRFIQLISIFLM